MIMQFDLPEVQTSVDAYHRARGGVVDNGQQVQLAIIDCAGQHMGIVGCAPVGLAIDVKPPEGGTAR